MIAAVEAARVARLNVRLAVLVPVWALAILVLAAAAATAAPRAGVLAVAGALLVAALVAEVFPVPIRGVTTGEMSLATVFLSTLAVVGGWQLAAIAGAAAMATAEVLWRRRPEVVAYNAAVYTLAAAAAGAVNQLMPEETRFGLAAAAAFYVVDICLVAAVVAASGGTFYPRLLQSFFARTSLPFLVMASFTAVLVALHGRGPAYMALLAPPLVAIALYQKWLHRALERRDELDRLKDEFVAVVSHEIRTPLASVCGAALTLQRPSLPPAQREQLSLMMRDEALRLSKLVDEVLWASTSERGREPTIVPLDAEALVRDTADQAAAAAPESVLIYGAGWGTALGDEAHVRRVLAGLVENAIKYSPDGGEVRVEAARHGDRVRFTVADQGLGIPAHERERVFEKFHRLDPQMTRGIGGTGLGLYIAKQSLERMGGSIWIEPNQGRGTKVLFELPSTTGGVT